jgi:integrase
MAMGYLYKVTRRVNGKRTLASPYWWACWRDSNGRRVQENTKHGIADRESAKKFLRGKMAAVDRGEPITASTGKITVAAALKAVMDDKRLNDCRWLVEPERMIDDHLLPHLGGKTKLSNVTVATARTYSAARQAEGAANATINRELALLRRAFRLAHKAGDVFVVPQFEMLREAAPRSGFVDRPAFNAIVALLPKWLRPAVTAMYLLGWRKSEVLGLAPHQVDMDANTITLEATQSKTGEKRVVTMPDELRTIVKAQLRSIKQLQRNGHITRWLFHRPRGTAIGSFRKRWRTACKNAGYPTLLVHDLRRSAARNFTLAGVPEQIAMKFLGHLSNSTFRRYRIVDERDLHDAAARLDAFFAQPKAKRKAGVVRQFATSKRLAG